MAAPATERLTPGAVVLAVLRVLAEGADDARVRVLRLALDAAPALESLVLRTAPGGVVVASARRAPGRARSGGHRHEDATMLDLPVRGRGANLGLLTATSATGVTAADAELLHAIADALALAAPAPAPSVAMAQVILDAEADRALVAAELDESVAEALVALRHIGVGRADDSAAAALADVRRIARELRARALDVGLRQALAGLRERGARVHADDPELDRVPPAAAVLVQRVAEAVCRAAVGGTQISARIEDETVKLWVESADNAIDASEVERWRRRARALHGELSQRPWGVELTLPIGTRDDEGRHDDRPDLR